MFSEPNWSNAPCRPVVQWSKDIVLYWKMCIQIFSISAQSLSNLSPTQSAINNDLICFIRLDSWGVKWWGKHIRILGWIPGQCIIAMGDGILDIDIGDLCKLYLGLTMGLWVYWVIKGTISKTRRDGLPCKLLCVLRIHTTDINVISTNHNNIICISWSSDRSWYFFWFWGWGFSTAVMEPLPSS